MTKQSGNDEYFARTCSMMGNTMAQKVGIRRRMGDDEVIDDWHDTRRRLNWIMLSDALSEDDLMQLDDASAFENDTIGSSGNQIQKKCMKMFGKQVCICQFLAFICVEDRKQDHLCYLESDSSAIKSSKHVKEFINPRRKVRIKTEKEMTRTESKLLNYGVNKDCGDDRSRNETGETKRMDDEESEYDTAYSEVCEECRGLRLVRDEFEDEETMDYNYYEYGECLLNMNMNDSCTKNEMVKDYAVYSDMAVNTLGNGDDFLGNAESVTDEVWKFETVQFVLFVSVLLCLVTFCFSWRSKWVD